MGRERGVEGRRRGAGLCEGELPFDAILSDRVKKVSSGEGDTLARGAAAQRQLGLWSSDFMQPEQPRWRTELELCRCESLDDDH